MNSNKSPIIFGDLTDSIENLVEDIDNTEAQKIVGGGYSASSSSSSANNNGVTGTTSGFGNFGARTRADNGRDIISEFRSRFR